MTGDPGRPGSSAPLPRAGALRGLKDGLRSGAHALLDPFVRALVRIGLRADHLTVLGLLLSAAAGGAFFSGQFRLGALLLALAGVCDILDGQVARQSGGETRFGAFLDSTLDRLAEALVLIGIAGRYVSNLCALVNDPKLWAYELAADRPGEVWVMVTVIAMLALTGSFLVSYTRARAEGLGLECKVGWFERPERLVLLIVAGLIKTFWAMSGALLLLAVLSFVTAAQRVAHVWKITRGAGQDG